MPISDYCSRWLFRINIPDIYFRSLFQMTAPYNYSGWLFWMTSPDDCSGWLSVIQQLIRILVTSSYFHDRFLFQPIIRLIGPTTDLFLNDGFRLQNYGTDSPDRYSTKGFPRKQWRGRVSNIHCNKIRIVVVFIVAFMHLKYWRQIELLFKRFAKNVSGLGWPLKFFKNYFKKESLLKGVWKKNCFGPLVKIIENCL